MFNDPTGRKEFFDASYVNMFFGPWSFSAITYRAGCPVSVLPGLAHPGAAWLERLE